MINIFSMIAKLSWKIWFYIWNICTLRHSTFASPFDGVWGDLASIFNKHCSQRFTKKHTLYSSTEQKYEYKNEQRNSQIQFHPHSIGICENSLCSMVSFPTFWVFSDHQFPLYIWKCWAFVFSVRLVAKSLSLLMQTIRCITNMQLLSFSSEIEEKLLTRCHTVGIFYVLMRKCSGNIIYRWWMMTTKFNCKTTHCTEIMKWSLISVYG